MSEDKNPPFNTYDEFFVFYLEQHSHRMNRLFHACGTTLSLLFVVAAFYFGRPWWALAWPLIAYSFAWLGHFVIEGNRPATWGYPWWSFISDFRMLWLMLTGKLEQKSTKSHSESA